MEDFLRIATDSVLLHLVQIGSCARTAHAWIQPKIYLLKRSVKCALDFLHVSQQ